MFKKLKAKRELKNLANFLAIYGRDAICETEIVKCWTMQEHTAFIRLNGNQVVAIGYDNHDKFHYIN